MKRFSLCVCLVLLLLLVPCVPAADLNPHITGISPSSAPNSGIWTVTITGTNLGNTEVVRLNKCKLKTGGSSHAPVSGTILGKGSNSVTAQFNLNGWVVGDYDVSLNAPYDNHEAWSDLSAGFLVYSSTGPTPAATTTTQTGVATTATTISTGDNSVFFMTDPTGATIFLDGQEVGTSAFTYYTNREGTFDVVAKKIGYEDYKGTVTINDGKRTQFSAVLSVLSSSGTTTPATQVTAAPGTSANGTPVKTSTTTRKSTLKIPTPLGTDDPPATEESPADPVLALGAIALGMTYIVIRRR